MIKVKMDEMKWKWIVVSSENVETLFFRMKKKPIQTTLTIPLQSCFPPATDAVSLSPSDTFLSGYNEIRYL